ncbi:TetR/AcrR family transcriptional regulator [Nocardia sp. NPDC005366]|uniref:TetR/AcrR family transcriptional regulator n=1 Tax=Nocardia sp. NPDC005366 TaxID=3156878 RepID=UPI0033AB7904
MSSPSLGRPVGANSEETRQRIVAATMRCVAEVGYSRATIREIARMANMTSGSLYHYFPNKAELMKATFLELADVAVPGLVAAAARTEGVLNKLMAVLDEGERLMRDYPYAAAFDRAIRAESAQHLHLAENSETIFNTLRDLIVDIVEQARQEGALGAQATVDDAADAIYVLLRGLNEHAIATPESYHTTVRALKLLLSGTLFDYAKLAPPAPAVDAASASTLPR